jgi:hypothetical protein
MRYLTLILKCADYNTPGSHFRLLGFTLPIKTALLARQIQLC